jgi:hypothetical protein
MRPRPAFIVLSLLAAQLAAGDARAQVEVEAVLEGRVMRADSVLRSGTVVLHRVSDVAQGEVDSTRVENDGTFSMRLPGLPNPAMGDIYFASVRHQGVMYFGTAVTQPMDLDSLYLIQTWDTLLAPEEGVDVGIASRSIFFEPNNDTWRITDVFYLHNDLDRTIVARPGGRVWTYPLPDVATEVLAGEGEMSSDVITYDSGQIVVRGAVQPGERMFVVHYTLATPEVTIPTPGTTPTFDVLVREPAPPLEITGLVRSESVELDPGVTFRRYVGDNVTAPSLQVALGEEEAPPPVQWIAVILALILGIGGLVAVRSASPRAAPRPSPRSSRRDDLLLEVARLDEDYERQPSPTESATREYQARRAALLRTLAGRQE